jgi:hypothetical protein
VENLLPTAKPNNLVWPETPGKNRPASPPTSGLSLSTRSIVSRLSLSPVCAEGKVSEVGLAPPTWTSPHRRFLAQGSRDSITLPPQRKPWSLSQMPARPSTSLDGWDRNRLGEVRSSISMNQWSAESFRDRLVWHARYRNSAIAPVLGLLSSFVPGELR